MRYSPKKIEKNWQKRWQKEGVYEPDFKRSKKPFYNLMMFPYPSAEGLHIGGVRTFTGVDIYGRFKRMQGFQVFEPMGLDGFGIHSENYALKIGKHPSKLARITEKNFYRQLAEIGNGFSWREHLETYDPEYYRWTQWIFIQLFKKGLAYRKTQAVNWCPSCLTVLADEQVVSGGCERCSTNVVKRDLEQWFFKITDYAERLLKNIEKLDWSDAVRIAQKNWIGKSEGTLITFNLVGVPGQPDRKHSIEIFTTRPDTLFGATFLVISPELAKFWCDVGWQAPENMKTYIEDALEKRTSEKEGDTKEKTGIFSGISAINPANQEKIPVWISNYVLAGYGTGAIMAVPAHDERDFEFAKKFDLPIKFVIKPKTAGYLVIEKSLSLGGEAELKKFGTVTIEKETPDWGNFYRVRVSLEKEKTLIDYLESKLLEKTNDAGGAWYADSMGTTNIVVFPKKHFFVFDKDSFAKFREYGLHVGVPEDQLDIVLGAQEAAGVICNSGVFDGVDSEKAKWEIAKFVGGKKKIQYHLRDWLISRQRYWGPPIPMIYCESCAAGKKGERAEMPGWYSVSEKDLPVKLPFVTNFRPTGSGKSPLASEAAFYKIKCPVCKKEARRETDVSDTFLDSAWYFLRYPSVHEKKAAWNKVVTDRWLPVDMYIGGAEHSVLHLLYSRFITMVFFDLKLLKCEEPFTRFRAHGLITKDGAKMSKSKGNVISPDQYIRAYGADAVRMYLAFLAPLEQGGDFRDEGIRGLTRFLNRVWKFMHGKLDARYGIQSNASMLRAVHKTIKKVTEDIESLQYNTAISALMILLNTFEENPNTVSYGDCKTFLKLLAPFAPHITEELWQEMPRGKKFLSIHTESWPKLNKQLIQEDTFELVVQINGKIRDKFEVAIDISEEEATRLTYNREKVKILLGSRTPRKIIFIPMRLINIVL